MTNLKQLTDAEIDTIMSPKIKIPKRCPECKTKGMLYVPAGGSVACAQCHKVIRALTRREERDFNRANRQMLKLLTVKV